MTDVQLLPLAALENNKGQIAGVPKNPRIIRDEQYKRLVASLQESDLTDYKPLLVYPTDKGKYVVLGGNMRLRALRELKVPRVSCIVIPTDTDVKVLKKAVIIDNNEFGEYDWELIANEWSDEPMADWGVNLPVIETESEDEKPKSETKIPYEYNPAYKIEVECESEEQQEELYNKLTTEGLQCRLLTL